MKNGYKIKNSPPQITLPLSENEIAQIGTACALLPQERFVAKSCRIQELQKELEVTGELCAQAERIVSMWTQPMQNQRNRNTNKLTIRYSGLPYDKYEADIGYLMEQYINRTYAATDGYVDTMAHHAITLRNSLLGIREDLVRAIEVEKKGKQGENLVETYLTNNLDARILSSVILPAVRNSDNDPKTSETDLLVICRHGVFVCEIKNYGKAGQTLEVQENGQFVKKDYYGRVLDYMGSPFEQNAKHHQAVRKVLAEAGLGKVPVYPAVIIANTEVNIDNQSRQWVMDMYSFKNAVEKDLGTEEYSEDVQQEVYAALQGKRMGERMFPILSIDSVAQYYRFAVKQLDTAWTTHARWKQDTEMRVNTWLQQEHSRWERSHPVLCSFAYMEDAGAAGSFAALLLWVLSFVIVIACGGHQGFLLSGTLRFILYGVVCWFVTTCSCMVFAKRPPKTAWGAVLRFSVFFLAWLLWSGLQVGLFLLWL